MVDEASLDTQAPQSTVKAEGNAPATADAVSGIVQPALEVSHVTHWYSTKKKKRKSKKPSKLYRNQEADILDRPALDDVSLSVNQGEIFGVLGPNGGGKTTLFRIISTLMYPDSGKSETSHKAEVSIFGQSIFNEPEAARFRMGVVFQSPSVDGRLTAKENLRHQGHLYGIQGQDLEDRIEHWLNYFGLFDRADDHVDDFSGGMRRRVELSKSLLHEPGLLLLDEASTGLDPGGRADMWSQIERLREEKNVTVVMTTHLMEEADRCDRLAILNQGKLVTCGEPAGLKAQIGGEVLQIRLKGSESQQHKDDLLGEITEAYGPWESQQPTWAAGAIRFEKKDGAKLIVELAEKYGERVESLSIGQPNLEDVFLHMTGHTLWEAQEATSV